MSSGEASRKPNRLLHATSPYLLQHAFNPVDWYEWGPEALTKAVTEDKPILVSIGYSSCHWCHVMERECFEVESIANIMNAHFVCIKVDREERPDIDQIYMEAVQAMGVHGGWPLNVFLNPKQRPFYGGTYFPPQQWGRLLTQINDVFQKNRKDLESTADDVSKAIGTSDLQRFASIAENTALGSAEFKKMFENLRGKFDSTWGGMDKAPKFVMPTVWMFLLRYFASTGEKEALDMVVKTLSRMTEAGLYDQLGGGFSRYSVDAEWFAPHFEKMMYDNAQLLSLYSEAYSITRNPLFETVIRETVAWIKREMTSPSGGFYSALDADSEGIEGKFYTWTYDELQETLKEDAAAFAEYYGITEDGNWEHGRNILRRSKSAEPDHLKKNKELLLDIRGRRIRPGLDDKILAGWNAMTIQGLTDAYNALGDQEFLEMAVNNISFLEKYLMSDGKLYRSYRAKRSLTEGFLEDYAFLICGYLSLYQCTFHEDYLTKARNWCEYVLHHFMDHDEQFFHFSSSGAESLIAKKKEVFDNVIPASNSVMARNLFGLGVMLDKDEWKKLALSMASRLGPIMQAEPSYASNWGIAMLEMNQGFSEVVVAGPEAEHRRREIAKYFLPFAIFLGTQTPSDLPLLKDKTTTGGKTLIYVCFDKTCKRPVETVEEALTQLKQ